MVELQSQSLQKNIDHSNICCKTFVVGEQQKHLRPAFQKLMKKQKIDMLVLFVAMLFFAANASAGHHSGGSVPDGGATASLFAVAVAGLAVVRRFYR